MLQFKSNLIKKGDFYSCNVNRTLQEGEFKDAIGISQEELNQFKDKLTKLYSSGRYRIISEYLCIHVASDIKYTGSKVHIYFYNLITTGSGIYHYTVSDYCKAMIPKLNSFGIEYKDVNYSNFSSLYIVNRANPISCYSFIIHYNGNEIVIEYNIPDVGNVLSIDLINKDITILNSDFKPTVSEQTYLNMICQIYCQDKKFMLDVLEDKFVLITA